ncbi:MAG: PDC sensor domain-containing protein, partial [Gammaproteobacteria bacterium]
MRKVYYWPIRWKLLALMWLLALVPVLTVAWIDIKTLARLGVRLATQTGQALSDQTRASLVQQADDYARLIAQERQLIELLVHLQARDATRALRGALPDVRVFWNEDFIRGDAALALQVDRRKYFQQSTARTHGPLPISYSQMVMHAVPGAVRSDLQGDAARLTGMLETLREMQTRSTDMIYWQHTALENGLHASYPGHGGYPENFDPRMRTWYQAQKERRSLLWSGPYWDVTTRLRMLSATLPLFDQQGNFIGVTGID